MDKNKKIKEQLLSKIKIDHNGCWIFQGKPEIGYGEFRRVIDGIRFTTAHRASFYLFNGEIPEGMMILHKCSEDHKLDNPKCINPSHLYCGTHKENMRDVSISGVVAGKNNSMYGKPGTRLGAILSEKTKRLISEKQTGNKKSYVWKKRKR